MTPKLRHRPARAEVKVCRVVLRAAPVQFHLAAAAKTTDDADARRAGQQLRAEAAADDEGDQSFMIFFRARRSLKLEAAPADG